MKRLVVLLACSTVSLFGQTSAGPRDFGNWLSGYGSTLRSYQANPGLPMIYPFTITSGSNLLVMYVDTDTKGYLASVIPTPGLTPSSVCGTSGVRCAADSDFTGGRSAAAPHTCPHCGGDLNQAQPGPSPEASARDRANAVSSSRPPLPTFELLPFPPAFPNQDTTPPVPPCDALHDAPLLSVDHPSGFIYVYGSCSGTVIKKIQVESNPLAIVITPDGSLAIVTSYDNAITFIDMATLTVTGTLITSGSYNPDGISISPDGTRAYVTSLNTPGALLIIDIKTRKLIQTLSLPDYPQSVFLTPDGSLAWITFPFDSKIMVLDTLTNTVIRTLSIDFPSAVAFNSTGTLAFVALQAQNMVQVLDAKTYQVIRSIPVGRAPDEIGIGPGDSFAVVPNFVSQSVTIINLNGYSTVTVQVPGHPLGLSMGY